MWQTIKDYLRYLFLVFPRLIFSGKKRVVGWGVAAVTLAKSADEWVPLDPAYKKLAVDFLKLIPWWMVWAATGLLILHTLILDNVKLRQRLKPRLRIDFDGDRFPYRQLDPGGDGFALRTFRISVENIGGEPITDIAVELVDMSPMVNVFIPVRLSRRRDNIPSDESPATPFKLNINQTQFIDVVKKLEGDGEHSSKGQIILCYATTYTANMIPDGNYKLTLAATGANCPRIARDFLVTVTSGQLIFKTD